MSYVGSGMVIYDFHLYGQKCLFMLHLLQNEERLLACYYHLNGFSECLKIAPIDLGHNLEEEIRKYRNYVEHGHPLVDNCSIRPEAFMVRYLFYVIHEFKYILISLL